MAWAEGALALGVLAALQFVAAWASVHAPWFRRAVTSAPTLLLLNGRVDRAAMVRQRISLDSLNQAVRNAGIGGLDLVAAVVLETNGRISVISTSQIGNGSTLLDKSGTSGG